MGLFKKSKKLEFPKFPEIPRFEEPLTKYEPTISKIKQEIEGTSVYSQTNQIPPLEQSRITIPERRAIITERPIVTRLPVEEGKPIFVKIEQYKEALDILNEINRKVKEAEDVFSEIEKIREERDKKIDIWKANLQKIKEKLMSVDKKLFEV